jgi:large subunit ribosomal protein L24
MRIRAGDLVQVIAGKDRGKQGKVLEAHPRERRVIVENLNVVKRHRRPRPIKDSGRMGTPQILPGGVFELAAPIPVSNVMLVCPACNRPTRVGYAFKEIRGSKDGKDGTLKVRVCRRDGCRQEVER